MNPLKGYLESDYEKLRMVEFFNLWTEFNHKLDNTITAQAFPLHERVMMFNTYMSAYRTNVSSDNLVV